MKTTSRTALLRPPRAPLPAWCSVRSAVSQSLAASAVFLINITSGMGGGWSSPAWSKLTEADPAGPGFTLDLDAASWVVALFEVGVMVGSLLAGALLGTLGRRGTLMLAPLMVLSSCALTYAAQSPSALEGARVLFGISFGLDITCSNLYIGEIASSDMRGKLCTFTVALYYVGVLLEYVIGPWVSFAQLALLPVVPAMLSLVVFFLWAPESPYFLASRGRGDEMRHALARMRGLSARDAVNELAQQRAGVAEEAADILRSMEEEQRHRQRNQWRTLVTNAGYRRSCIIVLFMVGTVPLLGTGTLLAYAQYLFRSTGSTLSAEMSAIVMCAVPCAACVASSLVIERAGRRPLLLWSALCNAVAMAAAGTFFFLKEGLHQDDAAARISWLPLVSLMVFMVSTNLGTATVPWVLISELLPQQSKTLVPSLAVIIISALAIPTSKLMPLLGERVGLFVPLWIFGSWSLVVFAFTWFLVPETRGKTLLQVQALLVGGKDGTCQDGDKHALKSKDQEEQAANQQHTAETYTLGAEQVPAVRSSRVYGTTDTTAAHGSKYVS